MIKNAILIAFFVALLSAFGCSSKQNIKHPGDIPVTDLNKSIQIIAPEAWNKFKTNKSVSLLVSNLSNNEISSNQDFGKYIFAIQDDQFIVLEDKMIVINGQDIKLKPGESVGVSFRVDTKNEQTLIRIYVIGKNDATGEPVTAFIDIVLRP